MSSTHLRRAFTNILCAWAVVALGAASTVRGGEQSWRLVEDHWYVMSIADSTAGWMHATTETDGARYRTTTETLLRMNRMNALTQVHIEGEFIETAAGRPISMASMQTMSTQTVRTEWQFKDDGVHLKVRQGDRTTTRVLPKPQGKWLPPYAAEQYYRKRRQAKAEEITYRTMSPGDGYEVITMTSRFVGQGEHEVNGRTVPVTIWSSRTSALPVDQTEKYSTDNVLVYWEADVPFGTMSMQLADKAEAMAAGRGAVPELIVASFVEPSRPMRDVMNTRAARLRLRVKSGAMPQIPAAGAQRVTMNGNVATLIIDMDDNLPAEESELSHEDYRNSSSMVDSKDPLVQKLAQRALRSAPDDPMQRAERLRTFVYDHIRSKGMETAFASASETARTRTGDCSEHGVLLAALLRADGIASRLAIGLVYVEVRGEGVFGWHMWTQALIDGRWIDLDATLPGGTRYHAGHVLTSVSSFSDTSGPSELNALFLLMGNLEIEVLETSAAPAEAAR